MAQLRMNPALSAVSAQLLAKVTGFAKFSFIVGSKMAFFAPAAALLPLAGAFGGISGSLGMLGMGLLIRCVFFGSLPLLFLAYHIPGFFASLYWARDSKILRMLPAILCLVLFIAHPVGMQSAWYSLFWVIPVVASCYSGLFFTALGSSFTAHAVGTLVWLYAGQLTAADFVLLAPVVIIERVMIAVSMMLVYKTIAMILNLSVRLDRGSEGAEWRGLHSFHFIDPNGTQKKFVSIAKTLAQK